jgi:uncharacterized membrane protein
MKATPAPPYRLITSLVLVSLVSIFLLTTRVVASDSLRYIFLVWNLLLAALVPILSWWLVVRIKKYGWLKWQQIALTILWLGFLPNSFYLATDLIHLRPSYEASYLFDVAMLISFVLTGLVFGFLSVYMVHRQLLTRLSHQTAHLVVGLIFLMSSFAIYLGRFTRWNTWDVVLQPAGLLFDVSDRFVNPGVHSQTYITTITFFVVLFSFYLVIYEATNLLRRQ